MANQAAHPVIDFLKKFAPFDEMEGADLAYLASGLEERYFTESEEILTPRDGLVKGVFIIKQGVIEAWGGGENGAEAVRKWQMEAGEMFPVGAMIGERAAHNIYKGAEGTFVFFLPGEVFRNLLKISLIFAEFCARGVATLLSRSYGEARIATVHRLVETLPLTDPIRSFMSKPPLTCPAGESLRNAMESISRRGVDSIVVTGEDGSLAGIFTLKDLLHRVIIPEIPLGTAISNVMTPTPKWLPPDAPIYSAVEVMAQHGFTHLPVVDEGCVVGVVSERDLFSLQRVSLVQLARNINRATVVEELVPSVGAIHRMVDQLLVQGVQSQPLNRILTDLNDHVTRRVIHLVLEGHSGPIPPITWLSFGSEGRLEQTLKTDQDNGILFVPRKGETAEEGRRVLLPLARKINKALNDCGYTLCKGNIMAGNPECCLSLEEWRHRFGQWISGGTPQDVLQASIFFDFRVLHGDEQLGQELKSWLFAEVRERPRFLRFMAENALENSPPLGLFWDFSFASDDAHPHMLNLKLAGTTPIVDAARIWALQHGIEETNTQSRFRALKEINFLTRDEAEAWVEGHAFIQQLRLGLQRQQAAEGREVTNFLDPDTLNSLDRRILKEVFRQIRKMQSFLALDFQQ